MARHFFPGDLVELPNSLPAVNTAFTWWSERVSGLQYSDVLAADGVSGIPLVTDGNGIRPGMFGPEGVTTMYCETGISIRFPVYADDRLRIVVAEDYLTSLVARVAALEAGGVGTGTGDGTGGTVTVGAGGNAYVIHGAASTRTNPVSGGALPAGAVVIWDADTLPAAFADGIDIWLNAATGI